MSELKEIELDEVSKHNKTESCWLIIGNDKNGELGAYFAPVCVLLGRDNFRVSWRFERNG